MNTKKNLKLKSTVENSFSKKGLDRFISGLPRIFIDGRVKAPPHDYLINPQDLIFSDDDINTSEFRKYAKLDGAIELGEHLSVRSKKDVNYIIFDYLNYLEPIYTDNERLFMARLVSATKHFAISRIQELQKKHPSEGTLIYFKDIICECDKWLSGFDYVGYDIYAEFLGEDSSEQAVSTVCKLEGERLVFMDKVYHLSLHQKHVLLAIPHCENPADGEYQQSIISRLQKDPYFNYKVKGSWDNFRILKVFAGENADLFGSLITQFKGKKYRYSVCENISRS